MNILVAFNDGYVMPTKIMLKSVIANNDEPIDIYCLYDQLSKDSMESINSLQDHDNVRVYLIHVDRTQFTYVPVHSHFSVECYFRLFAHRYIDEKIDRILWLDGDIIVNGSLQEFYYQEFGNKCFIAVEEETLGRNQKKHEALNIPNDVIYVNSGVLLMNLKEMRQRLNDEKIIQYIKENQQLLEWVDQDVYNGLLYNEIKVIERDYTYNCPAWKINNGNKKENGGGGQVRVIHYSGKRKPWKKGYDDEGFDLYWKYGLLDNEYKKVYIKALISHYLCKAFMTKKLRPIIKKYLHK